MSKLLLNYTKQNTMSANSSQSKLYGDDRPGDEIRPNYNDEKYSNGAYQSPSTNNTRENKYEKKDYDDYFKNNLNDDTFVGEELHDDCVYQITLKKVFKNKHANANAGLKSPNLNGSVASRTNEAKPKVNPFGTYRPIDSTGFYSYISDDTPGASNAATMPASTNSSDGLIYTRVKIKQLKYASLEKFIG